MVNFLFLKRKDILRAEETDIVYIHDCNTIESVVSAIIPEKDIALFIAMKTMRVDPRQLSLLVSIAETKGLTLEELVRRVTNASTRILETA